MERRQFFGIIARGGTGAALASGVGPGFAGANTKGAARRPCDVAIVGAGLSGLTAARVLTDAGIDVLVLEAQERVGGRTLTINPGGTFIDHGGQWVSPGNDRLMALARDLGVSLFDTWHDGDTVDWNGGQRSTYRGLFPAYWTESEKAETTAGVTTLGQMADAIDLAAPWEAAGAAQLDDQTLEEWLEDHVVSSRARHVIQTGILGVFNSGPGKLSLLAALFVVKSAQDLIRHFNPIGVNQRFVGGAQQLCQKMARQLPGRVLLNTWVHEVNHTPQGVEVVADIVSVRAERAIITLPPALAGRIRYRPALPAARDHLTESTPMGWVIKVHCVYPTRFWREQGLSGAVTSDEGAIRSTADNSPPSGSPGVLVGFIEGAAVRELATESRATRRAAVLADLVRYFGPQAGQPMAYHEHSWGDDEFTRGAYGGYWTEGLWTTYGPVLRAPIGTLHWAGTETSPEWNGKMEGGVRSGERVAAEVLAALR